MATSGSPTQEGASKPPNSESTRTKSRSPSPDVCSICLGAYNDKCYTNGCFHMFCFICLLEWAKVKLECPLCKKNFKEIFHNITSYNKYDVHKVPIPATPSSNSNFRLRPHSIQIDVTWQGVAHARRRQALHRFRVDINQLSRRATTSRSAPRTSSSANFRRYIYAMELYCEGVHPPGGVNRVRDVSPRFYRENPAQTHRLIPWLNRELLAVLPHGDNVNSVLKIILSAIRHVDLRSPAFRSLIRPYLLRYSDHFAHEFRVFATSPYDVENFDRFSQYSRRPSATVLSNYNQLTLGSDRIDYLAGASSMVNQRRSRWSDHPNARPSAPLANPYTNRNNQLTSEPDNPLANIRSLRSIYDEVRPSETGLDGMSLSTAPLNGTSQTGGRQRQLNIDISVTPDHHLPDNSARPLSAPLTSRSRQSPDYSTAFPLQRAPSPRQYHEAPPPEHAHPLVGRKRRGSTSSSDSDVMVVEAPPTCTSELVVLGDSTSDDESRVNPTPDFTHQEPEPRKGSAMMNYQRSRLSLSSSSASSPDKSVRHIPSVLERCRDPGLSELSSSEEGRSEMRDQRRCKKPERAAASSQGEGEDIIVTFQAESIREKSNYSNRKRKHSIHKHKHKKKKHKRESKKKKEKKTETSPSTDLSQSSESLKIELRLPHIESLIRSSDHDSTHSDTTSTTSSPQRPPGSKGKRPKHLNRYLSSHRVKTLPQGLPSLSTEDDEPRRSDSNELRSPNLQAAEFNCTETSTSQLVERVTSSNISDRAGYNILHSIKSEASNDIKPEEENFGNNSTIEIALAASSIDTGSPMEKSLNRSNQHITEVPNVCNLEPPDERKAAAAASAAASAAAAVASLSNSSNDPIIDRLITPIAAGLVPKPDLIKSIREFTKSVIAPKYN